MKLIYAGIEGSEAPYTSLLFNCTRNPNCERSFFVPVNLFSDIVFYADLSAKPDSIEVEVLNVCNSEDDVTGSAIFSNYVVGQKPDGNWYGVFGSPVVTPPEGVTYSCFFFRVKFTVGATTYVYYSEQMCFPLCETLTFLQGCYPNVPAGSDAFDCNGIYYGVPTTEDILGTINYRYFHWAFLRMASITEQKNKLSFTVFNSKKTYKNEFSRESLLEFELVPTFFKNVLIGIFNRGNIKVAGVNWRLSEQQEFNIIDNDSKLWKMDTLLAEECKQYFGCGEDDCVLPEAPCLLPDPGPEFSFDTVDGVTTGVLNFVDAAPFVEWELYDKNSLVLIASGDSDDSVSGDIHEVLMNFGSIHLDTTCYFVRWRIRCGEDPFSYTDWVREEDFGQCSIPPERFTYECERYLCSNCAEPIDTVIADTTNPFVTLFKYYKSQVSSIITLRPIATSVSIPGDVILGGPHDLCVQACEDTLPPVL